MENLTYKQIWDMEMKLLESISEIFMEQDIEDADPVDVELYNTFSAVQALRLYMQKEAIQQFSVKRRF